MIWIAIAKLYSSDDEAEKEESFKQDTTGCRTDDVCIAQQSQMFPRTLPMPIRFSRHPSIMTEGRRPPKLLIASLTSDSLAKGSETCSARSYRPIAAEPIAFHEPVAIAQYSHAEAAAFNPLVRQVASPARKASFVSLARGTGVFEDSWLSGAQEPRVSGRSCEVTVKEETPGPMPLVLGSGSALSCVERMARRSGLGFGDA